MDCKDISHKDVNDCFRDFCKLTYARNNNTIVEMSLVETNNIHKNCDMVFYKILMVRLRRRYDETEWKLFKDYTEKNIDLILNKFDFRWLLSVVDTYADCGTGEEKSNAMLVDSFFTFEKLRLTEKCIYDFVEKPKENKTSFRGNGIICSINIGCGDDTINNYFKRILNCLESTAVLYKIFIKFMDANFEHDSLFSILSKNYVYIKWGYDNYKKDII